MGKNITIEKLLEDIDNLNGDDDVKKVLKQFVEHNLMMASGLLIIWTSGKHVEIDGTHFSETESVWALEKAKYHVMSKGISFNGH